MSFGNGLRTRKFAGCYYSHFLALNSHFPTLEERLRADIPCEGAG